MYTRMCVSGWRVLRVYFGSHSSELHCIKPPPSPSPILYSSQKITSNDYRGLISYGLFRLEVHIVYIKHLRLNIRGVFQRFSFVSCVRQIKSIKVTILINMSLKAHFWRIKVLFLLLLDSHKWIKFFWQWLKLYNTLKLYNMRVSLN